MASCYLCGAPNAEYRREVYTGSSRGSFLSRRSFGISARTHSGIRSVCESCAKSRNYRISLGTIFWFIMIWMVFDVFVCPSSNNIESAKAQPEVQSVVAQGYEPEANVISTKGIKLRTHPNSTAELISIIPYQKTVKVMDEAGPVEQINGKSANWYKVNYNGKIGWAYGAYLSEFK